MKYYYEERDLDLVAEEFLKQSNSHMGYIVFIHHRLIYLDSVHFLAMENHAASLLPNGSFGRENVDQILWEEVMYDQRAE